MPPSRGVSSNVISLTAFQGFRNSSVISIRSGVEEVISIEPAPALRLPRQA